MQVKEPVTRRKKDGYQNKIINDPVKKMQRLKGNYNKKIYISLNGVTLDLERYKIGLY